MKKKEEEERTQKKTMSKHTHNRGETQNLNLIKFDYCRFITNEKGNTGKNVDLQIESRV